MKKPEFKAGDTVELKDKGTMFVDPATGFSVTGAEKQKLTKPVGRLTGRAIVSGALLVVGGKPTAAAEEPKAKPAAKEGKGNG